tara:strand:+ start:239 stop:499 length:261 start_codon:yes stop_codon:yes gene_type:complete
MYTRYSVLGPAVTVASTGSLHQAGLSYISSKTVKQITGRTATENIKTFLEIKKDKDEEYNTDNANNFFNVVKIINKSSGVKNLANQ